jgi:hypothetical protein
MRKSCLGVEKLRLNRRMCMGKNAMEGSQGSWVRLFGAAGWGSA